MLRAVEQIRRMRGGAQSHLMRCSDENYYVVKFQNNPQHRRILVNELLGTRLARRMGLPTAPVSVVHVSEELIRLTPELCVETPRSRIPCTAGLQFASRYPEDPRRVAMHDFLPDEQLRAVDNVHEFAGMLVFDKWTCNTNGRQTVFFAPLKPRGNLPVAGSAEPQPAGGVYHAVMIDQGFCFNAGGEDGQASWQKLLAKWDETLSNALQLAPQKGVHAGDLDAEPERLYTDHVAPERGAARVGAPGSRGAIRSYCAQVWKQARVWDRLQKGVRVDEFTFPGDPMRIDYAYRRNGTRGFVQTLSASRAPGDVKSLAYTVERIRHQVSSSEFTAVNDVHLLAENERHRFVQDTLRDAGIDAVPLEGFAVWAAKLRPTIQ
jgi:HipA-like protein